MTIVLFANNAPMRLRRAAQYVAAGCTSGMTSIDPQLLVMCSTSARGIAGRCSPGQIHCSEVGFSADTSGSGNAGVLSFIVVTYNRAPRSQYAPTMDISVAQEGSVAVLK